jgi:hypothetical protein
MKKKQSFLSDSFLYTCPKPMYKPAVQYINIWS